MKLKIFKFKKVTSTNDVAINLIKTRKKMSGYVHADIQTNGRGTHGKKWISYKGNLFGSIFFHLKKEYPPFNEFSLINGVIISKVLKHFCIKKKVKLKFPNDVFLNGKKVCGILQELITLNNKKFLIIGIGMNIVSNPKIRERYKSTNISVEIKKKVKKETIVSYIIHSYESFFKNLDSYNYINLKKNLTQ